MSQDLAYNYMKNRKGIKFTSKLLSQYLKISVGSANNNCKKLCKSGMVKHEYFREGTYRKKRYWVR